MTPLRSKDLNLALIILVGLTVLSVGTNQWEGAGFLSSAVALFAAWFKSRQVLDHFLGLKQAHGPWRNGLAIGLGCLVSAILLVSLLR